MIRFRIKELIAEREFRESRVISLMEIAEVTGISRSTLSKIANEKGYSTATDTIDSLCEYFECSIADLLEFIPAPKKPTSVSVKPSK